MHPADRGGFLLFTDGLIEGRSADRDASAPLALFGEERVREVLAAYRDSSAQEVAHRLRTSVEDFTGGALADDVCMIVCRLTAVTATSADCPPSGVQY